MASNIMYLDTHFPTFTGRESAKEVSTTLLNYLKMLTEQLRYTLQNLDATNFNTDSLKQLKVETTEDLVAQVTEMGKSISDLDGGLNTLSATVRSMSSTVQEMSTTLETVAAQAQATAESLARLTAAVQADADGNVTIGGTGKNVELTGNVTVNGTPV